MGTLADDDSGFKKIFSRKADAKKLVVVPGCPAPAFFLCARDIKGGNGAKKFLVSSLSRFVQEYTEECDPEDRNFYEIILDEYPCKLFFDCEFVPSLNPDTRMDTVLSTIHSTLEKIMGKAMKDPIRLDANGKDKQSTHLIYDDVVFASRHHSNHCVCTLMMDQMRQDKTYTSIQVKAGNGRQTTAVDLAVYDTDRNFRMYGSRKAGSTRVLYRNGEQSMDDHILLRSLVTVIKKGVTPIRYEIVGRGTKRKRGAQDSRIARKIEKDLQIFHKFDPNKHILYDNGKRGDRMHLFEISPSLYCPKAKRRHRKNNTYFVYNKHSKRGFLQCADPDCKDEHGRTFRWGNRVWP